VYYGGNNRRAGQGFNPRILLKKHRWGSYYFPTDTLVNFLSRKIKRDGKRIRKSIEQLVSKGYILLHKGGRTISLNPTRGREIVEYLRRVR